MSAQPPDSALELALAVIGYQWATKREEFAFADAIQSVEALQAAAEGFPDQHLPLAELYPHVARMAALSLGVLAALGDPDEVDGLRGFEGFHLWRESR
jgi:hypothetical protein